MPGAYARNGGKVNGETAWRANPSKPAARLTGFALYTAPQAGHISLVSAKPPGDRSTGTNSAKSDPADGTAGKRRAPAGADRPLYVGAYERGMDTACRLQLPAQWRRAGAGASVFFLVPWPGGQAERIRAFSEEQFRRLADRLGSLAGHDNAPGDVLSRQIASGLCRVESDSRGRLVLPGALARAAGLTRRVVLVGLLDSFEIWDAGRFHAELEGERRLTDQELRRLEL